MGTGGRPTDYSHDGREWKHCRPKGFPPPTKTDSHTDQRQGKGEHKAVRLSQVGSVRHTRRTGARKEEGSPGAHWWWEALAPILGGAGTQLVRRVTTEPADPVQGKARREGVGASERIQSSTGLFSWC